MNLQELGATDKWSELLPPGLREDPRVRASHNYSYQGEEKVSSLKHVDCNAADHFHLAVKNDYRRVAAENRRVLAATRRSHFWSKLIVQRQLEDPAIGQSRAAF